MYFVKINMNKLIASLHIQILIHAALYPSCLFSSLLTTVFFIFRQTVFDDIWCWAAWCFMIMDLTLSLLSLRALEVYFLLCIYIYYVYFCNKGTLESEWVTFIIQSSSFFFNFCGWQLVWGGVRYRLTAFHKEWYSIFVKAFWRHLNLVIFPWLIDVGLQCVWHFPISFHMLIFKRLIHLNG